VELIIVLLPFLTVFLGLIQLALVAVARLTVEYAAFSAARAAVVTGPRAAENPQSSDDVSVSDVASTVRTAAVLPLAGVSPVQTSGYISVSTAIGGGDPNSALDSRTSYAEQNASVTISPQNADWNAQVTATLKYRFACQVPLAKQVICQGASGGGYYLDMTASHTLTNQGKPR